MFIKPRNILFLHPGKTGGTSVEYMLKTTFKLDYLDMNINKNNKNIIQQHLFGLDAGKYLQHLPLMTSLEYIHKFNPRYDIDSCYMFTIVRNPFTKLYSSFVYNGYKVRGVDFRHFVMNDLANLVQSADADSGGGHFKSQYKYTNIKGRLIVDHVCRFETLNEDLKVVFNHLGFPDVSVCHKNKGNNNKYNGHYSQLYNDDMVRKIYEVYKTDFMEFDYSFDRKLPYSGNNNNQLIYDKYDSKLSGI